ncbi:MULTISPECIES: heme o synthase [Inquilinus]|uniref:Protoheme IX farnesyltransferase n=1 Tax=Inquilinus ginsengisoli TaxID=363840 RepID=A0ABU1JU17_9PROT|nr:heme o synthase [Inquilinus ginsengisoli]MDR6292120.1 protoheme IX farnesyltransferase [Inquilinus ginsengisoli]
MVDVTLDRIAKPAAADAAAGATWQDYFALLKPRVMTLVVFTGIAGLVVAPGHIHPVLAATAILCIAVGAGAAGAINMWYDRDIDAIMSRTCGRPIVRGRIAPSEALGFGVFLSVAAVLLMGLAVNWTAAGVLALASAFYVFVYTMWLKRRTPQNIVIGGAAGAFPPMIGWAAVTGDVTLPSILLFALIFMWTPPHFWALALFRSGEYAKAGVPMLPVVSGARETKRQMLAYTLLLFPIGIGPWLVGIAGLTYAVGAALLGLLFILCAVRVMREDGEETRHRAAKQMFGYSIFYLFAIFGLLIVDHTAVHF